MKHARNGVKVGVAISILNPSDDFSQYDFHPSDRGYMLHEVNGELVNPLTRVEGNKQYFIVTEQHIKLLSHFWIRWELTGYGYGVPCVDVKRPYGNSGIDEIIDILDLPYRYDEDLDGYSEMALRDEDEAVIRKLHHETLICMQIVVRNASIKPGEYVADRHDQNWRPYELQEETVY